MPKVSELMSQNIDNTITNVKTWGGIVVNPKSYGAKGDGSTDDTQAFQQAFDDAEGKIIIVPEGTFLFSTINITTNTSIFFSPGSIMKINSTVDQAFNISAKCRFYNMHLDGNNLATCGILSTGDLPELYDCEIEKMIDAGVMTGGTLAGGGSDAIGSFRAERTKIHGCARAFMLYGNNVDTNAFLIDCSSFDNTGQPYFISQFSIVQVIGGEYTGGSGSAPNIYICNDVTVDGGYYHDMQRGPTIGRSTYYFTVTNTIVRNCNTYGVSIDTKIDDVTYDYGKGIVANNEINDCALSVRVQSNNVYVHGNQSVNHTGSDAAYLVANSDPVYFGGNICTGGNGKMLRSSASNVIVTAPNISDISSGAYAYGSDTSSPIKYGKVVEYNTTGTKVFPNDADVVLCDTTAGSFLVQLASANSVRGKGKRVCIIKTSASNTLTVGPATNTLINGSSSSIAITSQYGRVEMIQNDNNWIVTNQSL